MNSGAPPDQTTLEQLKSELAEGLKADAAAGEKERERLETIANKARKGKRSGSGSGSDDGGRKRGRVAGQSPDDVEDDCQSPFSLVVRA